MELLLLFGAAIVLVCALVLGTVVHELAHAAVLHAFGIPYEIEWLPASSAGSRFPAGVVGRWASVTPGRLPASTPVRGLQVSALAPLLLALPFVPIALGVVPDPLASNNPVVGALAVGWLACALPSPQDFSTVWYPGTVADRLADG